MRKLVLVRHGQSTWNLQNRFTGWIDVNLSSTGILEARRAGVTLKDRGYDFDAAMTSYLKRAAHTLHLILEEIDRPTLATTTDWRLNERHYGALQGLNKKETTKKHGEQQVLDWRRGYAIRPPGLGLDHLTHPRNDPLYTGIPNPPGVESLADTVVRVGACWKEKLVPLLSVGQRVLVVAHGNSLRAMVKLLDHLSEEEILEVNIPTAIPLVYELDENFTALRHYYLADKTELEAAVNEVRNQATTDENGSDV